jgi:hypothetical protein
MKIHTKFLNKTGTKIFTSTPHQKIIHHNQVGFIPGMHRWLNIHKSLNVIQHINSNKDKNHLIISIDIEKAMKIIQFLFLIKALMKLRIDGR